MREGQQRAQCQQENNRQRGQQNVQRNLVGRLLAFGAFDHADHAIQKAFAGVGRDAHDEPIGEHRVPPVTALRSPPLSRMTGALSPVMALSSTEATPSITSPSPAMIVARFDQDDIAFAQVGSADDGDYDCDWIGHLPI